MAGVLDLIDDYKLLVHSRIAGRGPTLFEGGLRGTRRLDLVSAETLRCDANSAGLIQRALISTCS